MQIVTIGNLKGGTGKSTFAVNLAVAAIKRGIRTVVIDLDPQQSAGKWADQRQVEDPAVLSAQASRLQPALREAERLEAELAVMDTAAHDSDILKPAIDAANVVLIPCRPSGMELQHVLETAQLVAERRKPVAVILNAVPARAHELDEASRFIERLKVPLAPLFLSELRAYARAVTAAQGVSEYEPHGKAAQEIGAVLDWLAEHMKIRVSRKDGKYDKKKSDHTAKRVA
jgi:chromosome partitioning protein